MLNNVLNFLGDLAKNNERPWFESHKKDYVRAKAEFHDFLILLLKDLVKIDPLLRSLDPSKLTFRIYRDVRFSKDKSPFKINMGAFFSGNGKKISKPGYYLHIQPGNESFFGGGVYMPEAPDLFKIRQKISTNGKELQKIIKLKSFMNYFLELDQEMKLKNVPRGFNKENEFGEFLKLKNFIAIHKLTDKQVLAKDFNDEMLAMAKTSKQLVDFLRKLLEKV